MLRTYQQRSFRILPGPILINRYGSSAGHHDLFDRNCGKHWISACDYQRLMIYLGLFFKKCPPQFIKIIILQNQTPLCRPDLNGRHAMIVTGV